MSNNNLHKDIPSIGEAMADLISQNRAIAGAFQVSKQTAAMNGKVAPLCPHCKAEWSHAELQQKECFTCGYPDPWDALSDDDITD